MAAAAAAGLSFDLFTVDPDDTLAEHARDTHLVDLSLLREICTTVHPQDVAAVADWRPDGSPPPGVDSALVLCGMADPGNVGTTIRTAAALGLGAVVLAGGTCDVTNPKAMRASAGAVFSIPVCVVTQPGEVRAVLPPDHHHVAAVARGGDLPTTVHGRFSGGFTLWLGGEARGLEADVLDMADSAVTIPIRPAVDSLNVGAAAAILLWEFSRQLSLR